jgi:hypothetical protein
MRKEEKMKESYCFILLIPLFSENRHSTRLESVQACFINVVNKMAKGVL